MANAASHPVFLIVSQKDRVEMTPFCSTFQKPVHIQGTINLDSKVPIAGGFR